MEIDFSKRLYIATPEVGNQFINLYSIMGFAKPTHYKFQEYVLVEYNQPFPPLGVDITRVRSQEDIDAWVKAQKEGYGFLMSCVSLGGNEVDCDKCKNEKCQKYKELNFKTCRNCKNEDICKKYSMPCFFEKK